MAYDSLDALLRLALLATFIKDKKELKKSIIKISKKCKPTVQRGVCNEILKYPNLHDAIFFQSESLVDLYEVAEAISRSGHPGMVIYKGEAYPLQINVMGAELRQKEDGDNKSIDFYRQQIRDDKAWAVANEEIIATSGAHALMNHLNMQRLACEVILFKTRNFSGVRHTLEIERGVARKFNQFIGDTNYFL